MDRTILAVSFGTSDEESRETCIAAVENSYAEAFPGWKLRRAFTSSIIRKKLSKEGIVIGSPEEEANDLRSTGNEFVVASTHFIPGHEYEKLAASMKDVPVTEPLLMHDSDLDRMAEILCEIHEEENRTLIVMGHGTDHEADIVYKRLRDKLSEGIYLACVEGSYTIDTVLEHLDAERDHCVTLMPLMLVAGDHARNDMAGDEPDSWKMILSGHGYDVKARIKGLGSDERVQNMFVKKLAKVIG